MKDIIAKIIKKALEEKNIKMKNKEIEKLIEIPPNHEFGDYSFPCFFLTSLLKQDPKEIALELRKNMGTPPDKLEDIQTKGAYINFFANKSLFINNIINKILKEKENFGRKKIGLKGMVEFSQANTHKAFHVGHIRGTSIGESLSRIREFFGEKVIRANYQGDTGMHVAKWLWCYQKYHGDEKLVKDESWIASIYVDAVKRLEKNKRLQVEVEEINRRLALGIDNELNALWKKTRKFSLDSLERIYQELNTKFDIYYFESDMEKEGKKISQMLVKRLIAEVSESATIVNLERYNLGIIVLLRRDGTVLYPAKDLALAKKKFEDNHLDWSIYVIANEQDLYMKQIAKILKIMGFKGWEKIYHVSFGVVRLPHGKMSSRTGENILYSEFLKEVTDYAKSRIQERSKKLTKSELEKRALAVSIAAIKYSMLKQNPNKNIIFSKVDALNFEGDTGPYLLYSYARASSILRKVMLNKKQPENPEVKRQEIELAKKLSLFPEIVNRAYNDSNPSGIANYSYELSQIFNEFYHACPVISSDSQNLRIKLVEAFKIILKSSLNLLGIETLEEM